MSKFTNGKWIVKELFTTWGVFAVNEGKREPVADCLEEADARLTAAAPEMYDFIASLAALPDEQCMISPMIHNARKLIARIDGEEEQS